jgi:hypothetical protein
MFCPKCATQNVDGASYCRSCGANISLVPQALSGQLPVSNEVAAESCLTAGRRSPSIDYAIRKLMMGVAFAVIVVLTTKFVPGSGRWSFWLVIPAMLLFGKGFGELIRLNVGRSQPTSNQPLMNTVRPPDLAAPKTGELLRPVPSVTEGTTRHLAPEARTRALNDQRPS